MHTRTRFITCLLTAAGHLAMNLARLERYKSGVMPPSGSVGETRGRPLAKATPSADAPLDRADKFAKGTYKDECRHSRMNKSMLGMLSMLLISVSSLSMTSNMKNSMKNNMKNMLTTTNLLKKEEAD